MAEYQSAPDSWVGEEVQVLVNVGSTGVNLKGVLESVGERGVIVARKGAGFFYPWTGLTSIQYGDTKR